MQIDSKGNDADYHSEQQVQYIQVSVGVNIFNDCADLN